MMLTPPSDLGLDSTLLGEQTSVDAKLASESSSSSKSSHTKNLPLETWQDESLRLSLSLPSSFRASESECKNKEDPIPGLSESLSGRESRVILYCYKKKASSTKKELIGGKRYLESLLK